MASITPAALAGALDVSEVWVREILRANYWEQAPGKGGRWKITPAMAEKVHGIISEWRLEEIDHLFVSEVRTQVRA